VITIYSPTGIVQGTESMTTAAEGSMQNRVPQATFNIERGDYIKQNEVVFKLVNTDKVWGVFNVMQGQGSLIKSIQPIRFSSELDENDFINESKFMRNSIQRNR
jgi:Cu(I)/Ag(I) efflux system membrane fusion protein